MATFDDVGARVICGGLHPDHSTVAEFVRRNTGAVLALLPESVKACAREGLVSLELVAGDGTKLKASASMAANVTAARLDAQITELEALIDAEFRGWVQDMLDGEGTAPAVAVQQQRRHHHRVIRPAALTVRAVRRPEPRQVHLPGQVQHPPRQVPRRQPLPRVGRHQHHLARGRPRFELPSHESIIQRKEPRYGLNANISMRTFIRD